MWAPRSAGSGHDGHAVPDFVVHKLQPEVLAPAPRSRSDPNNAEELTGVRRLVGDLE